MIYGLARPERSFHSLDFHESHAATSIVVQGDEVDLRVRSLTIGGGRDGGRLGAGEPGRAGRDAREPVATPGAPIVSGFSSSASSRKRIGPIASSSPLVKSGFLNRPAIDANAVAAPQIADQHPVVSHRQATVPARNLRRIDADITLEMPADQEDRTLQDDQRGGSPGSVGRVGMTFGGVLRGVVLAPWELALASSEPGSPAIWTMT